MTWTTQQSLSFGPVQFAATDPKPAPYFVSGRKLYAIGMTSGTLEPIGAEHLVGEMGGVWAHPVKFLNGWNAVLYDAAGRHDLIQCVAFEGHVSDVALQFVHGPLRITRTDFVASDHAALIGLLHVTNEGDVAWSGHVGLVAEVNILPAWFSGYERGGVVLEQDGARVVAWDAAHRDQWGMVFGSATPLAEVVFGKRGDVPTAELRHAVTIEPGHSATFEFAVACDHQRGQVGALQVFNNVAGRGSELLDRTRGRYHDAALGGVTLETPDQRVNTDWVLAKANLLLLEAQYDPYLRGYLLAGIPEYPNLFGCDSTYTTPGATAAGFATIMRSTLTLLGEYADRQCGRVPHEITTNGRVFNPGNTQETPQFAIAVWDYFRWTGDLAFLRSMYPICREGVLEYLPSIWNGDRDGYPSGDAMVERHGMGSFKLDSACYLHGAWNALANMARVLDRPEAGEFAQRSADWLVRFERDWWLEDVGLYADSLHADGRPQLDGHWTQVVPLQLGIARSDRAQRVLENIERDFTNRWGLVHTRGREDRVWTLPTGLLVLALLRHGRSDRALEYLNNIGLTARFGMLGALKELIPEGLCFVQLWSAGLYAQGILEGLLGLDPAAHEHQLRIAPMLPTSWPFATVRGLRVGAHVLDVTIRRSQCIVVHQAGPQAIEIVFQPQVAASDVDGSTENAAQRSPANNDLIRHTVAVGEQGTLG